SVSQMPTTRSRHPPLTKAHPASQWLPSGPNWRKRTQRRVSHDPTNETNQNVANPNRDLRQDMFFAGFGVSVPFPRGKSDGDIDLTCIPKPGASKTLVNKVGSA